MNSVQRFLIHIKNLNCFFLAPSENAAYAYAYDEKINEKDDARK